MALTGKNNHHSVLDENSSFYHQQEEKTEKQKLAEMNNLQRLVYFKDYYLVKCLICMFAVGLLGVLLYSCFQPKKTKMLFVAVVQDSLLPEGKETFKNYLEKLLITNVNTQEIILDDTFPTGYETEAKLVAYLSSKEIDLIISSKERFIEMAEAGFFEDLNEFMPELSAMHEESLCWSKAAVENNISINSDTLPETQSNTSLKAYGICISDCKPFKNAWPTGSEAIIGIVSNSQNKDHAKLVLTDLFS